jgi:hypothetical protein
LSARTAQQERARTEERIMATPTGAGRTGTFTTETAASDAMSAAALVFGNRILVLAFQLRARKDDTRGNVAARPA